MGEITLPCRPCSAKREVARQAERLTEVRRRVDEASEIPHRFAAAEVLQLAEPALASVGGTLLLMPDMRGQALEADVDIGALARRAVRGIPGFALVGPVGVGKTHAMAALLNAARKKFIPGCLMSVTAMLASVRSSFDADRERTEARILRQYRETPLLVLNDLDKIHGTEWALTLLFDLINLRYEERLPTFLTANASAVGLLEGAFRDRQEWAVRGPAIIDRLLEMCPTWVEMLGRSRRRPPAP